jgi:hypothetical protein
MFRMVLLLLLVVGLVVGWMREGVLMDPLSTLLGLMQL